MRKKLLSVERVILAALIILLPTQTGKHFWPAFAYINGIRVDYLSPTLYCTDLLILALVLIWVMRKGHGDGKKLMTERVAIGIGLSLLFIGLNTASSTRPFLTLYAWAKLGIAASLFWYVKSEAVSILKSVHSFLPIALTLSSLLAIAQTVKQSSLGGPWYLLGERWFSLATPGIATTQIWGRLFLRPYATFPHPNALAGFILASLLFMLGDSRRQKTISTGTMVTLGLSTLAIALSFSQSAWIVTLLAAGVLLVRKFGKKAVPLLIIAALVFFWTMKEFPLEKDSILLRQIGSRAAITMIESHTALGVGLGNFIPSLDFLEPRKSVIPSPFLFYQPVHNVFLLLGAEIGLLGLVGFVWLFGKGLSEASRKGMIGTASSLGVILLLGFVDHYWITLQQTRLLFIIILATAFRTTPKQSLHHQPNDRALLKSHTR